MASDHVLTVCLWVGFGLFLIGILGVLVRDNILVVLMSLELMLGGASLVLVAFSNYLGCLDGCLLVLFVLGVGAVEVALALVLITCLYRRCGEISIEALTIVWKEDEALW